MILVPMVFVATRNDRDVTTGMANYEATLENALVSRTKYWDKDPEDARMMMTVTAMLIWRPSAAREVAVGPMLFPGLGGWRLLERYLGRVGLDSAMTKMLTATRAELDVKKEVTTAMHVTIWDVEIRGKVLVTTTPNAVSTLIVQCASRGLYARKAYGDMKMLIIMIVEGTKEVMASFQATLDGLDDVMETMRKNKEHHTVGRPLRIGNSCVHTSAASRLPQAEATICRALR